MDVSQERRSAVFLLVILVIIIGLVVFILQSLKTDPISETIKRDEVVKMLIVLNDGEGNALATDVLAYYPPSHQGALFNILGNTGAIYQSLGRVDRIDAIYKEHGISTYISEVSKLTGLSIPFYMEISLDGLRLLTDLLGGMKVFVPSPVDYQSDSGERWLLPSGAVTLDGDKIQTYIQYILPTETESEQIDRRQTVLIALLSLLHDNRSILLDKKNFPLYAKQMQCGMQEKNLYTLLSYISELDAENLNPQAVTGLPRIVDGKSLLFPYQDGQLMKDITRATIRSLLNSGDDNHRVYVIEVLNGTTTQGAARNAALLLQGLGYEILQYVNADRTDYEHTAIINHSGNNNAVQTLADFITCRYIIEDNAALDSSEFDRAEVDFTIVLGSDWDGRYVRGGYTGEIVENVDLFEPNDVDVIE